VNLQNSPRVPNFTKVLVFTLAFFVQISVKAWEVDFSRRHKDTGKTRGPASLETKDAENGLFGKAFDFEATGPTQEIVILNTEKGFIPENIKLKKGHHYRIHVVNVNEKEKNVSFILDSFSEHHGTFYGQPKSFTLTPKTDGIFSYQCPETAKQGKLIIYSDEGRKPATE
jgi:hypothetical protein